MEKKRLIYADNAATTRMSHVAFEEMSKFMFDSYANASQPYSFARTAKKALLESREIIADCIGASHPEEILFTSCGTESDNWIISHFGIDGANIITSPIEHKAILNPCKKAKEKGCNIKVLSVNSFGEVEFDSLQSLIDDKTVLVSVMTANNEIGTIQDIEKLARITHSKGIPFHTDAVQAVGHIPINVNSLDVDYLSASAHKFNGPKGIGFLYKKSGQNLGSYVCGGTQEFGLRAGTENIAAIIAMAKALQENCAKIEHNIRHIKKLEETLLSLLKIGNLDFKRNGVNQLPGNISLSFKDKNGEAILHRLDLMSICVSTGSACDSNTTQISHVLKAIKLDPSYALGTIRISLSKDNTEEEMKAIAFSINKIVSN